MQVCRSSGIILAIGAMGREIEFRLGMYIHRVVVFISKNKSVSATQTEDRGFEYLPGSTDILHFKAVIS
jgi:hypothetical protein